MAVSNKRVLIKTGFISRNTIEVTLSKVESVTVDVSPFGKCLPEDYVSAARSSFLFSLMQTGHPTLRFP